MRRLLFEREFRCTCLLARTAVHGGEEAPVEIGIYIFHSFTFGLGR
jgi:hypothetical protein